MFDFYQFSMVEYVDASDSLYRGLMPISSLHKLIYIMLQKHKGTTQMILSFLFRSE